MALPTVTETLDNVNSITNSTFIRTLQDGVYGSNPLMRRLIMDERVLLTGGKDIRQPLLYAKGVAASYQGLIRKCKPAWSPTGSSITLLL